MLRIQREANGEVVLKISGRLDGENLTELKKLIESDETDRRIVLDLRELTLVDHEAVGFLREWHRAQKLSAVYLRMDCKTKRRKVIRLGFSKGETS